ncbi:hypothetical protein X875_2210 [Mannheimia varigena USDA-ARS-USMARC-1388]|uniref:hypothetical protein n=1 Tax=Mannheimia varigena TaxID=85404 RepID=UPI0003E3E263|nr:hypothetical protein [Mannheimia varigena]AHG78841.1 hypothetical protein X875_2210 [Mannheimia varigena USDA-ARS-USMARC-1388]QLB17038.1 hypothetical protein A6B40_05260 [Mannheimia varigena]
MSKETLFMLFSVLIALVIIPASYMFSNVDPLESSSVFKQFGMLSVASACSFLAYFLAINPKIRRAFIGGAALTTAVIQAWAIYGVLLSKGDPKGAVVLFQIYLLSSLGLLLVSTIWVFARPRWIYPQQGSAVKYALFGGSTTVINYFIILFIFYIFTL